MQYICTWVHSFLILFYSILLPLYSVSLGLSSIVSCELLIFKPDLCLVSWNCFTKRVCVYYLFVFPHPREQIFYLKRESSPSLYYTYVQESFASKVAQLRNWSSDHPQTLRPSFQATFFRRSTTEKQRRLLGLKSIQKMCISSFGKWAWPVATYANKNEEQPRGFAGRIFYLSILVSRSQTTFLLLYWVGKNRVWWTQYSYFVLAIPNFWGFHFMASEARWLAMSSGNRTTVSWWLCQINLCWT